jgi:hypothetical protein
MILRSINERKRNGSHLVVGAIRKKDRHRQAWIWLFCGTGFSREGVFPAEAAPT